MDTILDSTGVTFSILKSYDFVFKFWYSDIYSFHPLCGSCFVFSETNQRTHICSLLI